MWEFIRSSNQWWTYQKKNLNPSVKARERTKKLSRILMHLEGNTTYFRPSNLCLVMICVTECVTIWRVHCVTKQCTSGSSREASARLNQRPGKTRLATDREDFENFLKPLSCH